VGFAHRDDLWGFMGQLNDKRKAAPSAAFLLSLMISEENREILVYINVLAIASVILSDCC
jgi:hypothetical protein